MAASGRRRYEADFSARQRAARATALLMGGARLSTSEMALKLGLTYGGAYRLLVDISGSVAIRRDEDGVWEWIGRSNGKRNQNRTDTVSNHRNREPARPAE